MNPTTTICALALRTARHIAENRQAISVPQHESARHYDMRPATEPKPHCQAAIPRLNASQRECLTAWGNALIPPIDDIPGAGTILAEETMLGRIFERRPDMAASLARVSDAAAGIVIGELARTDPKGWFAVLNAVSIAYSLHPGFRQRIGYDGQAPKPVKPDNYPAYMAEGLLDHLLDGSWTA